MTNPILGTAYEPGLGLCEVRQLRPGSASMVLTPIEYHPHYTDNPRIRHRNSVDWRSVNPQHKEAV